ncbi:MAG: hypothetical protein RLZZ387_644 [Chloroflexota bacterium]|jgi:hypothetical protein
MIYELRTYWATPGKAEALHSRFRTLTLGVFARRGMQLVGFWTPTADTETNGDLVYLMAFPDEEAGRAAWDAFRADPEWQAGKAASEVDGPLAARVTSVFMQPTDYSPMQ